MSNPLGCGRKERAVPVYAMPDLAAINSAPGWVYILMGEDESGGLMKIGYSTCPFTRWANAARNGEFIVPVKRVGIYGAGTHKKAQRLERALHTEFRKRRVIGEWFRFDFRSKEDKADFVVGCRKHLTDGWWQTFPFSALAVYADELPAARRAKHQRICDAVYKK